MSDKVISAAEFAKHKTPESAWIIIDGDVYDVSKFAALHPGGEKLLLECAGEDCTDVFYGLHKHEVLTKYGPRLLVGRMEGTGEREHITTRGELSRVPYCEPSFFQGAFSPYYQEDHKRFRAACRAWLHENVAEEAEMCEMTGKSPSKEVFAALGKSGYLAGRIGPGEHLKRFDNIFGIKPEEFTYFHEAIMHEEVSRLACPGFVDGIGSGMEIGLPPVLNFGHDEMKEKVGREVLFGEKRICLAITEPFAGSDVANVKTTATLSPDGSHYIVNGTKKWITNGADSDYFVTLCRTGGEGMGGLSMLLIERVDGLETKKIKTSYSPSAGTAYITFEDVKVPAANLIGFEGAGFLQTMYNFNHERWFICCFILAGARGVIQESILWANQRKAFGKSLLQQPVVRQMIGKMICQLEGAYNWFENVTYQMTLLPYDEQSAKLAGQTSLLKYHCTRVAHDIADISTQLFGGRGITQSGMGKNIERFHKTYKFAAILGGSEEIMNDLGVKMMSKKIPKNARL